MYYRRTKVNLNIAVTRRLALAASHGTTCVITESSESR